MSKKTSGIFGKADNQNMGLKKGFRSRRRVARLGEIFTPQKVVNEVLNMIEPELFADDDWIFFEPTAGHGNFVIEILNRRFKAFLLKAKKEKAESPCFYAVATSLHNLRAIEISERNIIECRERVFKLSESFLKENCKASPQAQKDFLESCRPHIEKNIICGDFFKVFCNSTLEKERARLKEKSGETFKDIKAKQVT